mmetsp:Transcript_83137/g.146869  ORF Transcript_83137/g.146869 Transcript_83137/m.146869 type:complete len:316 (+) Transcript_83137:71-1018(+)
MQSLFFMFVWGSSALAVEVLVSSSGTQARLVNGSKSIPRIIMQTSKEASGSERQGHKSAWILRNPGYEYHFLSDAGAVNFLTGLGPKYASAFGNLKPGAIRADFLRLAWLYKHGGFYIDIDKPVDALEKYTTLADIVIPQSIPGNGDRTCQGHLYNAFMAVMPGSLFIKDALDEALRRALSNFKAQADLRFPMDAALENVRTCYAIAGPVLLGEKLCSSLPGSETCSYDGGSVQGIGCKLQQHTRTTLSSGETILVFSEDELNSEQFSGNAKGEKIFLQARHYWKECRAGEIYKSTQGRSTRTSSSPQPALHGVF